MTQVAVLLLSGLLAQTSATTYERLKVNADRCEIPPAHAACLHWESEPSLGRSLPVQQVRGGGADADLHAAVSASVATWSEALEDCSQLRFEERPPTDARTFGYDERGENVISVVFFDRACRDLGELSGCTLGVDCEEVHDCWDADSQFIALTIPTYDCAGRLLDADIKVNGADFTLTTVDAPACIRPATDAPCVCPDPEVPCVLTDVENTLTHELGHVLGLDHSPFHDATMSVWSTPGEIRKRILDPASKSFVCEVYPAQAPVRTCAVPPLEPELGRRVGCGAGVPLVPGVLWLWWRRRRRPCARGSLR